MSRGRLLAALGAVMLFAAFTGQALAKNAERASFAEFEEIDNSVACTFGGNSSRPLILPDGYSQTILAREPEGGTRDLWDMNTLNETGRDAGRYLYRTHEVAPFSQVSVTDLRRGGTRIVAERADWERFDGIVWTPWGTILAAEETTRSTFADPAVPQATAGLVYEINPRTGNSAVRPAIGARSHEGLRFDEEGNLYGISESAPPTGGYIYKFTPDRPGNLGSGQLFVLRLNTPTSARLGAATWVPLDRAAVQINSDVAATAVGATGYARPEDVETGAGRFREDPLDNTLYVAITGEDRVLAIDLGSNNSSTAVISDYVRAPGNAPEGFDSPDNLALDQEGNLLIAEDPGSTFAGGKRLGDDVWAATPPFISDGEAEEVTRFASTTDCDAEPTGIYFDRSGKTLFVNIQHRGGDGADLAVAVRKLGHR